MNTLASKTPKTMKTQLTILAVALGMLAGCTEPTPPCLVQRATGFVNYVIEYTNQTITTPLPGTVANCALFTANGGRGETVPISTWLDTNPFYPINLAIFGIQLGGQPFGVAQIGLDKFAPGTSNGASTISLAPDILGGAQQAVLEGTPAANAYGIAPLQAENPDAQDLCYVQDFSVFGNDVDWGGTIGVKTVGFHYTNMILYETASAPGTQFQVKAEITISETDGTGTCTATFDAVGYAPAASCIAVEPPQCPTTSDVGCCDGVADGDPNPCASAPLGPSGGVEPLVGADVDPGICTNFNPDTNDPQWINYGTYGFPTGAAVNRYFPIGCDTQSGWCALPVGTGVPTVPIISSTSRP
jgi:hypothetical protein